ncbi:DUF2062 domain-containing protein [Amphritea sp. 1_MG-2023]|uniref:DUF2062 domain-containing protein n=1 Tax=Amphritea sp. 1_MG-2023 TaxID=3062670 RepID=UPI0026E2EAFF|nr:DUF2062 domain-containing protein [Amphritea sp. 1_MG-2023]MDO6562487.1 DUF2062 domain-containing protein [Amphritea sp. 1_MG-2023]
MPDERKLKSNRYLSWLGSHIHDPNLWHLTRTSVSRAFFVGLFCAFIPLPSQMLMAALASLFVRSNLPISVSLVWLTNPLTIPPMFYFAYWIGTQIIGVDMMAIDFEVSLEWLKAELDHIWLPLLVGSLICSLVSGTLGYLLMQRFWVWHVNKSWRNRKGGRFARRKAKAEPSSSDDKTSPEPQTDKPRPPAQQRSNKTDPDKPPSDSKKPE